ncbi:MAG: type II toxin-antitoxin system ParD family antitoxin [Thermodesulfobacteriota bacterium]
MESFLNETENIDFLDQGSTITLPPDMLATIKNKVQSGAYGSTSELIREAMRLWQKKDISILEFKRLLGVCYQTHGESSINSWRSCLCASKPPFFNVPCFRL